MAKRIKIQDLEVEYELIHRDVRCPRLEFNTGKLQVILPRGYWNCQELIDRHRNWIYRTATIIQNALGESSKRKLNLERTEDKFKGLVVNFMEMFSEILGVHPKNIRFKRMRSRWGSCSFHKKNITINMHLRYVPEHIIGYVVFHELTHLLEMRHTKIFWKRISRIYPDYKAIKKELLMYWYLLQDEGLLE